MVGEYPRHELRLPRRQPRGDTKISLSTISSAKVAITEFEGRGFSASIVPQIRWATVS